MADNNNKPSNLPPILKNPLTTLAKVYNDAIAPAQAQPVPTVQQINPMDPSAQQLPLDSMNPTLKQMAGQASPEPQFYQQPVPMGVGQFGFDDSENSARRNSIYSNLQDWSQQKKQQLAQLQQYIKDYSSMPQRTDFRPLAAFVGALPGGEQNNALYAAAQSMAPQSPEQKAQMLEQMQQQLTNSTQDPYASAYSSLLTGGEKALYQQNRISSQDQNMQQRIQKEARSTFNGDKQLNTFLLPRLEGAAKIGELIDAAKSGKVVANQALLQQLNNEVMRLEVGTQAVAEGLIDEGSLKDLNAKTAQIRDYITGHPQSAVTPDVIDTIGKMVDELRGSYQRGIDNRFSFLSSGMTPTQMAIGQQKHNSLVNSYSQRFGDWNGAIRVKRYNGQNYVLNNGEWAPMKGEAK